MKKSHAAKVLFQMKLINKILLTGSIVAGVAVGISVYIDQVFRNVDGTPFIDTIIQAADLLTDYIYEIGRRLIHTQDEVELGI